MGRLDDRDGEEAVTGVRCLLHLHRTRGCVMVSSYSCTRLMCLMVPQVDAAVIVAVHSLLRM